MSHQQSSPDPVVTSTICTGTDRFIFRYRWSRRAEVLEIAAGYLSRPDPEFTIPDLLGLAHLIAVREEDPGLIEPPPVEAPGPKPGYTLEQIWELLEVVMVALISSPQTPAPSPEGDRE